MLVGQPKAPNFMLTTINMVVLWLKLTFRYIYNSEYASINGHLSHLVE
jgi:hypothetical protein